MHFIYHFTYHFWSFLKVQTGNYAIITGYYFFDGPAIIDHQQSII